jgi:hypothetical protein
MLQRHGLVQAHALDPVTRESRDAAGILEDGRNVAIAALCKIPRLSHALILDGTCRSYWFVRQTVATPPDIVAKAKAVIASG